MHVFWSLVQDFWTINRLFQGDSYGFNGEIIANFHTTDFPQNGGEK